MNNIKDNLFSENIHDDRNHSSSTIENTDGNSASSSEIPSDNILNINTSETDDTSSIETPCENNTFPKIESIENGFCHIINSDPNLHRTDNYHGALADNRSIENGNNSSQYDGNAFNRRNLRSSTKEEKQRQNEEIVVLESSSISSETGSWEALFPAGTSSTASGIKDLCKSFLSEEKLHCEELHADYSNRSQNTKTKPPSTACFIDASTLFDDDEMASMSSSSLIVCPIISSEPVQNFNDFGTCDNDITSKVNLCDVDVHSVENDIIKTDAISQENDQLENLIENQDTSSSLVEHTKNGKSQSENEKIQGQNLFKNSIQQFSGHLISPKMPCANDDIPIYFSSNKVFPTACDDRLIFPETPHNSIIQITTGIKIFVYLYMYYKDIYN